MERLQFTTPAPNHPKIAQSSHEERNHDLVTIQDLARSLRHCISGLAKKAEYQSPAHILPTLMGAERKLSAALKDIEEMLPTATRISKANMDKLEAWLHSNRGFDYVDYLNVLVEVESILQRSSEWITSKSSRRRLQNVTSRIAEVKRIYSRAIAGSTKSYDIADENVTESWI